METNTTEADKETIHLMVGGPFVLFSVLILLISTILLTLIWKYLNSASITKQGVLLYLYEDAVGIVLIADWVWFAVVVSCSVSTTGSCLSELPATVMSFCICAIELQLLLTLNTDHETIINDLL